MVEMSEPHLEAMDGSRKRAPMVLRRGTVPELRPTDDSDASAGDDPVLGLPEHGESGLPDRVADGGSDSLREAQRTLHFALVVPDLKQFHALRGSVYAVKDANYPDINVKLHVLLQGPHTDPQETISRHALTTLGLVEPHASGLTYPEELTLGWNEPSPGTDT